MKTLTAMAVLAACSSSPRPPPPDACNGATPDADVRLEPCCDLPDAEAQACFARKSIGCHVYTCSVCPLRQIDTCQPDAARPKKLVVIKGQSNAVGRGLASDAAGDPRLQPLAAVRYEAHLGDDSDPPKPIADYAWGDLTHLVYRSGVDSFGIEMSLGYALAAAEPGTDWFIAKFAFGATSLFYNWQPDGVYPTMPAGQPNLFEQSVAFERAAIADTGATLAAEIWIQGESDADTEAHAQAYQAELLAFIAAERAAIPTFATFATAATPMFYGELVNAHWAARTSLRASQVADQSQFVVLVNQDGLPLADGMHFTAAGYLELGERYAAAILAPR